MYFINILFWENLVLVNLAQIVIYPTNEDDIR